MTIHFTVSQNVVVPDFLKYVHRHLISALLICACSSVNAGVIESVDDSIFGIDAVTRDYAAGLEWLDLTFSLDLSFNDIVGEFGVGGAFEGWRYALATEFDDLWYHATGVATDASGKTTYADDIIDPYVLMFGDTYQASLDATTGQNSDELAGGTAGDSSGLHSSIGILIDPVNLTTNNLLNIATVSDITESLDVPDFTFNHSGNLSKSSNSVGIGSWLVRSIPGYTVPEPSTVGLFLAGAIGLSVMRRQRDSKYTLR